MHQELATKGRRVAVHTDDLQKWHGRIIDVVDDDKVVVKSYNGDMTITCSVFDLSTKDVRKDTSLPFMHQEHTLRMLGDNFTLTRAQWEDLLFNLKPDSDLHQRITNLLKEND